jgi:hypothetical protein
MKEVSVLQPSEILEKSVHQEYEALEKGKKLPTGTTRSWGGKEYIKTEKGWRPKAKGGRDKSKLGYHDLRIAKSIHKKQGVDAVKAHLKTVAEKRGISHAEAKRQYNEHLRSLKGE